MKKVFGGKKPVFNYTVQGNNMTISERTLGLPADKKRRLKQILQEKGYNVIFRS